MLLKKKKSRIGEPDYQKMLSTACMYYSTHLQYLLEQLTNHFAQT